MTVAQEMAHLQRLSEVSRIVAPRAGFLALGGAGLIILALSVAPFAGSHAFLAAGSALLCVWGSVQIILQLDRWRTAGAVKKVMALVDIDATPAVLTDRDGAVRAINPAAKDRFSGLEGMHSLAPFLDRLFAAPLAVSTALLDRAAAHGHAWQDHASTRGMMRVSVFGIYDHMFLWRFERLEVEGQADTDLALPALSLDSEGRLIAANSALERLLDRRPTALDRIITDLPLRPGGMHSLAASEGDEQRRIITASQPDGGRTVYFLPSDLNGGAAGTDWSLFDSIPVPLLKITPKGDVVQANRSARDLLDDAMPQGRQLQDLVTGLGRSVKDWLQEAASGRGLNQSEFLQVVNQNKDVFVQVTLKPVDDGDGSALVAVLNDATELKTLEAQFVQSQKMQAIGQLAGGVAHDFNNLLTAISGHCDLLLMRHDQGDPNYGDLVQIHQNANRAASLVGQLLAFSRKQTLQPEVIDLRDSLSDLTHLLNRLVGEKVRLTLQHAPDLPRIRADKRQLEQVIMNLVVNARDAMPEGGEIEIVTTAQHLQTEVRRNRAAIPPGDYAIVTVTDHGVGIPLDKLPKIFEPFYTTKRTGEGTGLGLSTAYGIIKQTGGFIFADSMPGQGSVFTIYLPAFAQEAEAEDPTPDEPRPMPAATKGAGVILLVEDEAPVRAFASRALRLRGYTVLEAENAEQALDRLSDRSLDIDVFVTDVVMPGMDGPSWVREALKARPDTRVVFVSGYAEDALSDQQSRIPNSVFLPKPFSLQDLTATVQRQLH